MQSLPPAGIELQATGSHSLGTSRHSDLHQSLSLDNLELAYPTLLIGIGPVDEIECLTFRYFTGGVDACALELDTCAKTFLDERCS